MSRSVRGTLLLLSILGISVLPARLARAEPCLVADVSMPVLREALRRLSQPPVVVAPDEPSRWRGLLPTRMNVLLRGGQRAGTYVTAVGTPSERDVYLADQGMTLRFDWDFKTLWTAPRGPRAPSPEALLNHAVHAEELSARVARQLASLRKAQSMAQLAENGDPVCQDARADAEAALLVLESVVASARR